MQKIITAAVEALAELSYRKVEDLHVYFPSLRTQDIDLALALHERGVTVTVPCLREEQERNPAYSHIAVTPPQMADVLVAYRESDFHLMSLPYRLKLIITLQVPISSTYENLLSARGILCLHAANLRLATRLGSGMLKSFSLALLRQVDSPDSMKMVSEVLQPVLEMYQGWEEIALFTRKLPDALVEEKDREEIRVWRRVPSVQQCAMLGGCNLPDGPDFLIQRQGKPLEIISLLELRALISSAWAVWIDGHRANVTVLHGLLDCKQRDCPFVGSLAGYKKAA
jgi:hypothetical protein